jgi:oligopeptide transport system substrate-binding protein
MKRGRLALLALSAASLGLCLHCARKEPQKSAPQPEPPKAGGVLRILNEAPRTLDPVFVDDVYEGTIVNQIYEGLVRLDQDLSVLPALAEAWVVSEDGRLYTFNLRRGIRFHDGRPVTAAAVRSSIERALDPRKKSPCLAETYLIRIEGAGEFQAGRAPHIRGIEPEGEYTLRIRLAEPLSFFLSVLCMDQLKILPLLEPGEDPDRNPVGTGSFRLVSRTADNSVTLARNETYWGEKALLDSLRFIAATNRTPQEEISMLLRHEADIVTIGSTQRSLVGEGAGFRILRSPDISCTFLGMNTCRPPLDRLEVRQAVTMALDRSKLIPPGAVEQEVASGILPPRLAGYQPDPKVLAYDPRRARALLAEAGYNDAHPVPTIEFYTNVSSTHHLEEELARQLKEVGIRIHTNMLTWPQLDSRIMSGTAPLFTLSWIADVPDPDAFLWFLFRSGESNNLFAFSDAEVDSLLEQGRRMPPGPERFAVYRRAESRVLNLAPMIPLYNGASLYAFDPSVRGVQINPFGFAQTLFGRIWFDLAEGGARPAENVR